MGGPTTCGAFRLKGFESFYGPGLNSYYVITILMSRVLTGKVRRVGNSMAVIIPKELLEESGASEGDMIKLSLAIPKAARETRLESIAGIDRKARPFVREKQDRF